MQSVTENKLKKEINYSLNVLKCLGIFAVICIHCRLFNLGTKGEIITCLSRFAVPVFFMISGYFSFFSDNDKAVFKYKTRIIKLIKLFIISNIIYLIYDILAAGGKHYIHTMTLKKLFECIVFNVSFTEIHLWFISALIYFYIIFYVMGKINFDYRKLYKFVPILFIFSLIIAEFSHFYNINLAICYYRNFLFTGLPFFILGYYFHEKEFILTDISNRILVLAMIFGAFLTVVEMFAIGRIDLYAGTIILSVSMFAFCIKNPEKLNFKLIGFIGWHLYTSMYILHYLIFRIIKEYMKVGYFTPIIVFVLTALVCFVIYWVGVEVKKTRTV